MYYEYHGNRVTIPVGAEISGAFGPRGVFGQEVQAALNDVEPWEQGEDPIQTFDLSRAVGARAVLLAADETPQWGIYPHHTARNPGLSPFITLPANDKRGWVSTATLELRGSPQRPGLTRIYPGEYMPPLPWMKSARNADGGKPFCYEYWRSHAFLLKRTVQPLEFAGEAPGWYKYYQASEGRLASED